MSADALQGSPASRARGFWSKPVDFLLGRSAVAFALAVSATAALAVHLFWGQTLDARFGLIDDHEIVAFLGADGRLPWGEIVPTLLGSTEVGNVSSTGRFRPVYYGFRLAETAAWGPDPRAWYAVRAFAYVAFVLAAVWAAMRTAGVVAAVFALVAAATSPLWGDVLGRLGPAEAYGALLSAAGLVSGVVAFQARSRGGAAAAAAVLASSAALLCGVKETFIPLAAIGGAAAACACLRKGMRGVALAMAGAVAAAILIVAVPVAVHTMAAGQDIYAREVGVTQRLGLVAGGLRVGAWTTSAALVAVGIAAAAGLLLARGDAARKARVRRSAVVAAAVVLCAAGLEATQFVLYAGSWPTGIRYDFPGVFAGPAKLVAAAALAVHAAGDSPRARAAVAAALLLLCATAVPGARHGLARISAATGANVETTVRSARALDAIFDAAADGHVVVLDAHLPALSYEPMFAVLRYLAASGRHGPVAVRLLRPDDPPRNQLEAGLGEVMRRLSDGGGSGLVPLASIAGRPCIAAGLDGPAGDGCARRASFSGTPGPESSEGR